MVYYSDYRTQQYTLNLVKLGAVIFAALIHFLLVFSILRYTGPNLNQHAARPSVWLDLRSIDNSRREGAMASMERYNKALLSTVNNNISNGARRLTYDLPLVRKLDPCVDFYKENNGNDKLDCDVVRKGSVLPQTGEESTGTQHDLSDQFGPIVKTQESNPWLLAPESPEDIKAEADHLEGLRERFGHAERLQPSPGDKDRIATVPHDSWQKAEDWNSKFLVRPASQ